MVADRSRCRGRAVCAAAAAAAAAAAVCSAGAFVASALTPRASPPATARTSARGGSAAAAPAAPGGGAAAGAALCAALAACAAARRGPPLRAGSTARRAGEKQAEEKKEEPNMMDQIKRFGPAGIASYAITEGGFWLISIPGVCLFYAYATGEWPNLANQEDQAKVAGASFAFLNVARLIVPLRVGLALALAPWVDENVIKPFFPDQWKAWQEECTKNDAAVESKA